MELSIERVAQLQAEMDAGASVDEVLVRAGVAREGYYLAKEAHLRAIADELRGGRRVLSSRYQRAFVEHRSVLASPGPMLAPAALAPAPAPAALAPAIAPAVVPMPGPAPAASPARYQASFQRGPEPIAAASPAPVAPSIAALGVEAQVAIAELPPQKRKAELNATVGLSEADEAKLRALLSTPFDASAPPKKKKELLSTVAIDDGAVGETARMSVPEGLAAAAAAREALPFAKGAASPPPPPPPAQPVQLAELPPQKRNPAMASTVGLTGDDEAKLRALLSTPFDGAAPKKKKELLATVAVDDDAVGETAHMNVPEGLAAAAAAREALPFAKGAASPPAPPPPAPPPPAPPSAEPVLPPIGQLVEMQAALARATDRDALLASRGYSAEAWQSVLRRYGALMQSDPALRLRYESLLAQASAR